MRGDLLDAKASVDWAVSNLPAFQQRIDSWLNLNVHIGIEDLPAPATHNPIIGIENEPLPPAFNVEFGAYINVIRSSLDILATALAYRCNIPKPETMYFPIAKSAVAFARGKYTGANFVKGLPRTERDIIESLNPYQGGNEALWALHQLDIMRKHRRLIAVEIRFLRFCMGVTDMTRPDFVPLATATGWLRLNEKTILGLLRKGAPYNDKEFQSHISMNETGYVHRKPIIATLLHFADLAYSIIGRFDLP